MENNNSPLLAVGNYGVHLKANPAGTYSFFGTIVEDMEGKTFKTFEIGLTWFKEWYLSQPVEFQKEYCTELRNDIFAFIFST